MSVPGAGHEEGGWSTGGRQVDTRSRPSSFTRALGLWGTRDDEGVEVGVPGRDVCSGSTRCVKFCE